MNIMEKINNLQNFVIKRRKNQDFFITHNKII